MIVNGYEIKPLANLFKANLSGADLRNADLSAADLFKADLIRANLSGANLRNAKMDGAITIISREEEQKNWRAVCEAVKRTNRLDMRNWHGPGWNPEAKGDCGTTHCLAGWAQALCDDPVIRKMEPSIVGSILMPRHAHLFMKSDAEIMKLIDEELAHD